MIGARDAEYANSFMQDVADRVASRIQLTTYGDRPYLEAVEGAFGADIDFAVLVKYLGEAATSPGRYSPAVCTGATNERV